MNKRLLSLLILVLAIMMPMKLWAQEPYAVLSENNTVLTLYYDSQKGNRQGAVAMNPDGTNVPWGEYAESIINVTIDPSFVDFHAWTMANWFSDFTSLTTINGIEYLNTEGTTSLRALFQRCTSLESIDVSHFKTESVEDMAAMFNECNSLRSIDCSNFNTSNVLWTYGMFGNCAQLETINVSGFENVGECSNMFSHCPNLRTIYSDRDWDITLQINRETVFEDCNSLIGGNGTSYSATHGDCTYARLDREGVPGYFTQNDSEPYEPQKGVVVNLINNGDLEGEESSNFFYRNMQKSLDVISVGITDGVGVNDSRGLKVEATAKQDNVYDNEFLFQLNQPVSEGTKIKLSFDYRAEKAAKIYIAAHGDYFGDFIWDWPNPYIYADTEWQSYTYEGFVTSSISTDQKPLGRVDFSLNEYPDANIYYFDNVKFEVYMEDQCPKPTFTKTDSKVKIQSPFDAKIYYTLDGSTPTENSILYTDALTLSENATIKAVAVVDGYEVSDVATYLFEVQTPQGDDNIIQFADANVKAICVNNWDTDGDGELSKDEAAAVTEMSNTIFRENKEITSFDELQYFTGLTSLQYSTFQRCSNLASVVLPANLTSVGNDAFGGCSSLSSIIVPDNVVNVGANTWNGCSNVTYVHIGKGLASVNVNPFGELTSLETFEVDEANMAFCAIEGILMSKDGKTLVQYPAGKRNESFVIAETIETVSGNAFRGCKYLKSLVITKDSQVRLDEALGYWYIYSLEELTLQEGVEGIGFYAFMGCSSLKTIHFPATLNYIGKRTFEGCNQISSIISDVVTPFEFEDNVFTDDVYSNAILLVPEASVASYRNTAGWQNFKYINTDSNQIDVTFESNGVLTIGSGTTMMDALEAVGGRAEVAKTITAIVWNSTATLTNDDLQGLNNPNMLVYVAADSLAPANRDNVIIGDFAKNIVLTDVSEGNGNFYCPRTFKAEMISYTHEYRQQTEIGVARGWETIALPFTVQTIMHEKQGMIAPFGNTSSVKHFWLREMTPQGLGQATVISANMPYLISMPNNSVAYPAEFNLNGRVTFSSQDVDVVVTDIFPAYMQNEGGGMLMFAPCFQTLEPRQDAYALNVGEQRGQYLEGSVFESNYRAIRPFEAFTIHEGNSPAPQFIPVSDMNGGITDIGASLVNSVEVNSEKWYDLNGRRLHQKPTQKGVYILNGKKTVVK